MHSLLQQDNISIQLWKQDWQMNFNPDKCKVTRITTRVTTIKSSYNMHSSTLKTTNGIKITGRSHQISLANIHINQITEKGKLHHGFHQKKHSFQPAKCQVHITQDVCSHRDRICPTHRLTHQSTGEGLRQVARFAKNDYARTSSYTEMVDELQWDTLQHRRNMSRAAMLCKNS